MVLDDNYIIALAQCWQFLCEWMLSAIQPMQTLARLGARLPNQELSPADQRRPTERVVLPSHGVGDIDGESRFPTPPF